LVFGSLWERRRTPDGEVVCGVTINTTPASDCEHSLVACQAAPASLRSPGAKAISNGLHILRQRAATLFGAG
jgi:hypothetical protein